MQPRTNNVRGDESAQYRTDAGGSHLSAGQAALARERRGLHLVHRTYPGEQSDRGRQHDGHHVTRSCSRHTHTYTRARGVVCYDIDPTCSDRALQSDNDATPAAKDADLPRGNRRTPADRRPASDKARYGRQLPTVVVAAAAAVVVDCSMAFHGHFQRGPRVKLGCGTLAYLPTTLVVHVEQAVGCVRLFVSPYDNF